MMTDAVHDDEIYQIYAAYSYADKATLNARYEFGNLTLVQTRTAYATDVWSPLLLVLPTTCGTT